MNELDKIIVAQHYGNFVDLTRRKRSDKGRSPFSLNSILSKFSIKNTPKQTNRAKSDRVKFKITLLVISTVLSRVFFTVNMFSLDPEIILSFQVRM